MAGISDFCTVPEGQPEPARIGGLISPDLEKIVVLKADLALASTAGNYKEDAQRIERLGVPVFTTMQGPPMYHTTGEVLEMVSTPGLERMARFMAFFV